MSAPQPASSLKIRTTQFWIHHIQYRWKPFLDNFGSVIGQSPVPSTAFSVTHIDGHYINILKQKLKGMLNLTAIDYKKNRLRKMEWIVDLKVLLSLGLK